jgi:hypothetical protein
LENSISSTLVGDASSKLNKKKRHFLGIWTFSFQCCHGECIQVKTEDPVSSYVVQGKIRILTANLSSRQDLPTPESPMRSSLKR